MQPNPSAELRPRTLGAILDDAWRLYVAEAPLLLICTGILFMPTMMALLWLLANPWHGGPEDWGVLLLVCILFPLTGMSTGTCQEVFHRLGEKMPVTLGSCFSSAKRRRLNHLTTQVLILLIPLVSVLSFLGGQVTLGTISLMVWLPLWAAIITWHAVLAGGQRHLWKALRYSRRCAERHPLKAGVIVVSRLAMLLVGIFNLHLFLLFFLWVGDNVAGISSGFLNLVFTLQNPVYVALLGTIAWWLLSPFNEAVNYLFYVDARCRYEGLDLSYRIDEIFSLPRKNQVVTTLLLLGLILGLPCQAEAVNRSEDLRKAKVEIQGIQAEMKSANPYPGGQKWQSRLRLIGEKLDPDSDRNRGRYRWFFQAIEEVKSNRPDRDIAVLERLAGRLGILENSQFPRESQSTKSARRFSSGDIRDVVPPLGEDLKKAKKTKTKKADKKDEVKMDRDFMNEPDGNRGSSPGGIIPPVQVSGGFAQLVLLVLLVIVALVLVGGIILAVVSWVRGRKPRKNTSAMGQIQTIEEEYLDNPDRQNVQSLWQRADELARKGQFLEALRVLYLTVLAQLHQAHLIRYERTKTNGEYADQLRRKTDLHPLFLNLTGLFELKWYGERSCNLPEYEQCRLIADQLRKQTPLLN